MGAFAFIGNQWGYHDDDLPICHFHNCLEFGLCQDGTGKGNVEGISVEFQPGDICVVPPYKRHMFWSERNTGSSWQWIMVDPEMVFENCSYKVDVIRKLTYSCGPFVLSGKKYSGIRSEIEILLALFCQEPLNSDCIRSLLISLLSDYVFVLYDVTKQKRESVARQIRIWPALVCISEHYAEKLSIQTLADACNLSVEQFRRDFKEIVGCPPLSYLSEYRIQTACLLLIKTNKGIKEIAQESGYLTLSTFNREFASRRKTTPLKWRHLYTQHQTAVVTNLEEGRNIGILS